MQGESGNTNRLLVYGNYTKLIDAIKHFDSIQTSYRSVASTLLLADFAAIGFFLARPTEGFGINYLLASSIACVLGIVIITCIGLLDLVFQERLLVANYVEVLQLERKYAWLPRVHHYMFSGGRHHSSPARKAVYYIGCSSGLIMTMGLAFGLYFSDDLVFSLSISMPSALLLLIVYAVCFGKSTGRIEHMVAKVLLSQHRAKRKDAGDA